MNKRSNFLKNCGAASVRGVTRQFSLKLRFKKRDSKADILSISSLSEQIYSEEGLKLKMSALESLYCGQFASST